MQEMNRLTEYWNPRHRILLRQIYRISECTAAQRARGREFMRAREKEEEQDGRPWDD